jgi:S1-C subfamily serine protease
MADDRALLPTALPATALPPANADSARPRRLIAWTAALAMFAVAFIVMYAFLPSRRNPAREPEPPSARPAPELVEPVPESKPRQTPAILRLPLSADALFKRASPAVVQIVIHDRQGRNISSGSGFLIGTKGLVATNHHVIASAAAASVILADKTKLSVQGVAAMDEAADIAILKVAAQASIQPLELAGNDLPAVGAKVYAIGTPLGLFANTLSGGLVSGHREIERLTMIQTTAAISPGSSGGPLLGTDGKVLGVTTASARGGQNVNVVVPASQIAKLLSRCAGEGELTHFPLTSNGTEPSWSKAPNKQAASTGPFKLSRKQLAKCQANFSYYANNYGAFQGTIYNGNEDLIITRVVLVLHTAKWQRDYAVNVGVRPLASQGFFVNADDPRLYQHFAEIKSMTGISVGR